MSHAGRILTKYPAEFATMVLAALIGVAVATQVSSIPHHVKTGCDKLQGRKGQLHSPHIVSVDPDGHVYTGAADRPARVQNFTRYVARGCSGTAARRSASIADPHRSIT